MLKKHTQGTVARIQALAKAEQKHTQNTMESIRRLLSSDNPREALRFAREAYRHQTLPQEVLEIFWQYPAIELCPDLSVEADNKLPGILSKRGLSPLFQNATLQDFPPSLIARIPNNRGAYIYGPCGTGKTHLLSACLRDLAYRRAIRASIHGVYELTPLEEYPLMTSIQEVLLAVRRTFNGQTQSDETKIIDAVTAPSVLLVDDIGLEKPTEWALQIIFLIIDRRYRAEKHTFFSSNLSLSELSDRLDDRIASRIAGMCRIIQLKGNDRRIRQ